MEERVAGTQVTTAGDTGQGRRVSTFVTAILMVTVVITRSSTSILTPVWLDSLNNSTANTSHCNIDSSERHIDAFAIIYLVNIVCVVLLGLLLLVTMCLRSSCMGQREARYGKGEFAMIGIADSLGAVFLVYASSGCRTAPYLQSLAANFSIPATFVIRYLLLQKRPTFRKTVCAMLVLVAEFTAMMPDIFPEIEPGKAKHDEGGAAGVAGFLWPVCFFFGFVPMAIVMVVTEKAVKSPGRSHREPDMSIVYVMFWCYLFGLLSLTCLFWTDIIPGFGMADDITGFAKTFWFNMKCYVGLEGCVGMVNVVSISCTLLLLVNRLTNAIFLRYLEGANYLVIITTIQTPVVFLFFTLFDENPVKWHPHAYLSTWLSIVALCIMLPAIYIYDTGAPEVVPTVTEIVEVDCQTDSSSSETDPLLPPDHAIHNRLRYPGDGRSLWAGGERTGGGRSLWAGGERTGDGRSLWASGEGTGGGRSLWSEGEETGQPRDGVIQQTSEDGSQWNNRVYGSRSSSFSTVNTNPFETE